MGGSITEEFRIRLDRQLTDVKKALSLAINNKESGKGTAKSESLLGQLKTVLSEQAAFTTK